MGSPLKMIPHGEKGFLITFCGLDGCGKTTMIQLLRNELQKQGREVVLTKQPTENMRQSAIFRSFIDEKNTEQYDYRALSLLAASDRIQHIKQVILPALVEGKVVISDRYFYSCLANLRARGYGTDQWIYDVAKYIPKPDCAFFLDVSVATALGRIRERPLEKDRPINLDLQHRLFCEYQKICEENEGVLLNSEDGVEKTFTAMLQELEKRRILK